MVANTDEASSVERGPRETGLLRVDNLISQAAQSGLGAQEGHPYFEELASALAEVMAPTEGLEPEQVFRNQNLSHVNRILVTAAVLRLLAAGHHYIDQASGAVKAHLASLLDEVWAPIAYQKLALTAGSPTYDKLAKLPDVVAAAECELGDALESFRDLNKSAAVRTKYMAALNARYGKCIITPFLPGGATNAVDALFEAIVVYDKADGPDLMSARDRVVVEAGKLKTVVDACPTHYALRYLRDLADVAESLVSEHFEKHPIHRPAKLTASAGDKRYPLHEANREFDVLLKVTNEGPGTAYNVTLMVVADRLTAPGARVPVGELPPGAAVVPVHMVLAEPAQTATLLVELKWSNANGINQSAHCEVEVGAQRADVDWDALAYAAPYDLDPVETEDTLIGRRDYLLRLLNLVEGGKVGNCYVFGQKRVGKTSIVKTLASALESKRDDFVIVFLESGDYVSSDARTTLGDLGSIICAEVKASRSDFDELTVPVFEGGLARLNKFFTEATAALPGVRFLIILDEFDGLPIELYQAGALGDAVFKALRSLSGKTNVGLILVGGENMTHIWNAQGQELNKFEQVRVDYFDRSKNFGDYQDLVRTPIAKWIEVSDSALVYLYEQTAGNPFFTKLVCKTFFTELRSRRDTYVGEADMREAVARTIADVGPPSFSHFWDDGVLAPEPRRTEIRLQRRRCLLGLGEALRDDPLPGVGSVTREAARFGLDPSTAETIIDEYIRRQIVTRDGDALRCKVALFGSWLRDRGLREIMTTIPEGISDEQRRAEAAYVTDADITSVAGRWGLYRGRRVSTDDVRNWLNQFEDRGRQRIAMTVLSSLRFYGIEEIRSMMKQSYVSIQRELAAEGRQHTVGVRQRKRSHILVSYFDGAGKSGNRYATIYANANDIFYDNVIERSQIANVLSNREDVQALILVDDFVGTGSQSSEMLVDVLRANAAVIAEKGVRVYFVPMVAYSDGVARLRKALGRLQVRVTINPCQLLTNADRYFSERSAIFPDAAVRAHAEAILSEVGGRLEPDHPRGYGETQAGVVFAESVPNGTLPVLWKEKAGWHPLFPRHHVD